jgi:hypothetical protein
LRLAAVAAGFIESVESGQRQDPSPARGTLIRWGLDASRVDTIAGPYAVPEIGWQPADSNSALRSGARLIPRQTRPPSGTAMVVSAYVTSPPVFSARPTWTAARERVILVLPEFNVVEVRDAATGTVRMLLRLQERTDTITAADREAFFRSHLRPGHPYAQFLEELVGQLRRQTVFATVRPPVTAVVTDDRDRIWLADFDPSAREQGFVSAKWDVFSEDGEPLARVQFPRSFQLLRVHKDLAWGRLIEHDGPEPGEFVQAYRIEDRR